MVTLGRLLAAWDQAEREWEWCQRYGDIAEMDDRHHEVLHARQLVLEAYRELRNE